MQPYSTAARWVRLSSCNSRLGLAKLRFGGNRNWHGFASFYQHQARLGGVQRNLGKLNWLKVVALPARFQTSPLKLGRHIVGSLIIARRPQFAAFHLVAGEKLDMFPPLPASRFPKMR